MTHRYFAASEAVYENLRATLDAAWGLPSQGTQTVTCIRPAAEGAPRDGLGRVLVAVLPDWCEWEPAATMLPQLLQAGVVVEITAEQYQAALSEVTP